MLRPPHKSVLFQEAMDHLAVQPGGTYVDATCGAGGHAAGICERLFGTGRLVALDQDESALDLARKRLEAFGHQVTFVRMNFSGIDRILNDLKIDGIDGAIADLGVSSMQLDDPARGFSFDSDTPLDMRMDPGAGLSAAQWIARSTPDQLARIFTVYGEQPYANRIAKAVWDASKSGQTMTGRLLRQVVHQTLPAQWVRESRIDPATRVFMALRIAVNEEFEALESFLEKIVEAMNPSARLVIISFHSLEDRTVKRFFQEQARGCTCPKEFPACVCNKPPRLKILTKNPVTAGEQEKRGNPRARSAKLRAAEKLA